MAEIDARIALGYRPPQIENPLAKAAQLMQLQGAQSQNRLHQMALVQKEREIADDEGVRQIIRSNPGAPMSKLAELTIGQGYFERGLGFQKQAREAEKATLDADKTRLDMRNTQSQIDERTYTRLKDQNQKIASTIGGLLNTPGVGPQHVDAAIDGLQRSGDVDEQTAAKWRQMVPKDPAQIPDFLRQSLNQTLTGAQQLDQHWKGKEHDLSARKFDYQKANDAANRNVTMRGQNMSQENARIMADATRGGKENDRAFSQADKLRDEFQKGSGEFLKTRDAYSRILKAAENPDAASDLALIFNYMKMLDPGSVVREGEFATAQNAAGVPDQIRNIFNRIRSGQRLNPAQRAEFLAQARRQYDAAATSHEQFRDQYRSLSDRFGVNPENVLTDYRLTLPKSQDQGRSGPGASPGSSAAPLPSLQDIDAEIARRGLR